MNSYELSLKNTNLLSSSAILFGYHTIIGSVLELILGYLLALVFIEGQINEFINTAINMNKLGAVCVQKSDNFMSF